MPDRRRVQPFEEVDGATVEGVGAHEDPRVPTGASEPERGPRLHTVGGGADALGQPARLDVERARRREVRAVHVRVEDAGVVEHGPSSVGFVPPGDHLLSPVARVQRTYRTVRPATGDLMRNQHAGLPFDTADEDIAAALLDVSIPTLMLSLVHMSGDPELIRGRLQPAGLFLNEVQGYMTEEDKAEVRALALDVIRDYRDRGCPEPEPIPAALVHEMMTWLVCEDVPQEYVPMLMEEMELDGTDARRVAPD